MKVTISGIVYSFFWQYTWYNPSDKERSDYITTCFITDDNETFIRAEVEKHPKKRRENRENARKASLSKCLNRLFPGNGMTNPENKKKRAEFWRVYLNRPRVAGTPKVKTEVSSDAVQPAEQGA
jgi:hypothetical protein